MKKTTYLAIAVLVAVASALGNVAGEWSTGIDEPPEEINLTEFEYGGRGFMFDHVQQVTGFDGKEYPVAIYLAQMSNGVGGLLPLPPKSEAIPDATPPAETPAVVEDAAHGEGVAEPVAGVGEGEVGK